jgi:hypothetical protein
VNKFNLFFTGSMMLFVVNLLIANDMVTLWDGAEAALILQSIGSPRNLPAFVLSWLPVESGAWLFWLRLPGAVLIILACLSFFQLAKKLFGTVYSQYALLALAASFVVVNTGKIATTDSWAFATQWMSWLFLLLYLKQPTRQWQLLFYLILGLAVWIQPLETILFISLYSVFLYFFHPRKNLLIRLNPVAALLGATLLFYFTNLLDWSSSTAYWSIGSSGYLKFIALSLLAWLPFLGFLISGIREMVNKWKRKEELTIILATGLISALIGHAIVFHGILAVVVGRQLQAYFQEKFPYRAFVKTGAVLHLIFAFTVAVILTIFSFFEFRGVGFRSALAVTTVYWMPSFMAVIGLYGMTRRYVVVGTVWAGLLATLLFSLQVNPLIESRRGVVEKAFENMIESYGPSRAQSMALDVPSEWTPKEKVYGQHYLGIVPDFMESDDHSDFVLSRQDTTSSFLTTDSTGMAGWNDRLKPVLYKVEGRSAKGERR